MISEVVPIVCIELGRSERYGNDHGAVKLHVLLDRLKGLVRITAVLQDLTHDKAIEGLITFEVNGMVTLNKGVGHTWLTVVLGKFERPSNRARIQINTRPTTTLHLIPKIER